MPVLVNQKSLKKDLSIKAPEMAEIFLKRIEIT